MFIRFELSALTSLGQMEAITKEEVANAAMEDICGKSKKNLLNYMDAGMLSPTFAGKAMVEKIKTVPQECLADIENYIQFVLYRYN